MFCPVCKAEYRPGFTRCADCDVDLVSSLPEQQPQPTEAERADLESPELLWTGIDGGAFARITAALGEAEIAFNDEEPGARLLYSSMRHPLEIWIQKVDHNAARRVLAEVLGTSADDAPPASDEIPVGSKSPPPRGLHEWAAGLAGLSPPAPPEPTETEQPAEPVADDLFEDFDPDEATVEVWSSDVAGMAQMLKDCLRENGIGCAIANAAGAAGAQRVLVRPENEARAREIVREVVEGLPPA